MCKIQLVEFQVMGYNSVTFALETDDVIGFTPEQRTAVELQLCISIVSKGSQLYQNFEYPRYKNFYGYAQLMSGEHVVSAVPLNYLNQEIVHWRDQAFGIIETVGCYFKAYGAADSPPVIIVPVNIKTRQRYTSVRVKLQPTVLANCELVWEVGASQCGGTVQEPDSRQGEPPNGNNESYSPGDRPANQGGDNSDNTTNDGGYVPGSGENPPPGDPSRVATWKVAMLGTNGSCQQYTYVYDTTVTDPNAVVTSSRQPSGGGPQCGKTDMRVIVYVNGTEVNRAATGGDLNVTAIYFA